MGFEGLNFNAVLKAAWIVNFGVCLLEVYSRICPRCGRGDRPFIGFLCNLCYVNEFGVAEIPRSIDFTYCRVCGSYKYQGLWVEGVGSVSETLSEYLLIVLSQKIKPTRYIEEAWVKDISVSVVGEPGIHDVKVRLAGKTGNVEVEEVKTVKVKALTTICPSCSKKATKTGYNAIVQVRPAIGSLDSAFKAELWSILEDLGVRARSSIISVDEVKEGVDILVDDQNVARVIASKLKAKWGGVVNASFKITGSKPGGGRKGVLALSVKVLNVRAGTLLSYMGSPHIYVGPTSRGVLLVDVGKGLTVEAKLEDLARSRVLDAGDYVGYNILVYRLTADLGGSLYFMDESRGSKVEVERGKVKLYVDSLKVGGYYLVYQLGDQLYILGEARVEQGS